MFSIRFIGQPLVKLALVFMLAVPTVCPASVIARMQTSYGVIDIQLFDTEAPLTVANFISYAKSRAYANSIIHRNYSVPSLSIIQGGGYVWNGATNQLNYVVTNPPVDDEYSPNRPNVYGTIAMAKTNLPNSATSQWFFNRADNSVTLDDQHQTNGGFTVFGQVLNSGMTVVNAIAALPKFDGGGAFTDMPLPTPITGNLQKSNFVIINQVSVLVPAKTKAADRVFAYLESLHPERFSPAHSVAPNSKSTTGSGFYYRHYAKTKRYVAVANGKVYWGAKLGSTLKPIGSLSNLLAKAAALGY